MKEVSAGAIVFRRDGEIKYLLLFRKGSEHFRPLWGFPRGKIEESEKEMETVKREVEEETGLKDLKFLNFREKINWFYKMDNQTVYKESIFYLAETKTEEIRISEEHDDYKWCNYNESMDLLKFKNVKEILKKANEFLNNSLKNWV